MYNDLPAVCNGLATIACAQLYHLPIPIPIPSTFGDLRLGLRFRMVIATRHEHLRNSLDLTKSSNESPPAHLGAAARSGKRAVEIETTIVVVAALHGYPTKTARGEFRRIVLLFIAIRRHNCLALQFLGVDYSCFGAAICNVTIAMQAARFLVLIVATPLER